MKNIFLLLAFLSIASSSCKDDDTTDTSDYTVTININNPADNSTHNISEMIPLEVVFGRGTDEIIHHVKIELIDSNGDIVSTVLEEHAHQAGSYTYSNDTAFSISDAGDYKVRASSHDMSNNHADPIEISIKAQ